MKLFGTTKSEKESRPGSNHTWPVLKYTAAVLTIVLSFFFLPLFRQFAVIEEKTGRVVYNITVRQGDVFSVTYIHSVNKSPVEDVFEIMPDYGILLRKTVFSSFGAGIPFELEQGQMLVRKNDSIEIANIDRRIDPYLLKVGTVANHTLWVKGREIRLDSLTKPKNTVRLGTRRVSFYLYLRGIVKNGCTTNTAGA